MIRGTLDAFATTSIIHRRCGFLGLRSEDVPISAIDEVFVDPLSVLPRMGTLTVRCGPRFLTFEGVLDPEGAAARLLALRDRARMSGARAAGAAER